MVSGEVSNKYFYLTLAGRKVICACVASKIIVE